MKKYLFIAAVVLLTAGTSQGQFREKYRPQYHLSAKASSMADPKGLFIRDSTYHIYWFGQWEHAVSNDLIHWREMPKPMKGAPAQFSYFTGSVVVDRNNTSGFGPGSTVAVYTRHFPGDSLPETQALSVSHDGGYTYQYYEGNPVIDINSRSFRDPQVFWHEPTKKWVMVVALSSLHQVPIYTSPDLKNWTLTDTFGGMGAQNASWECPDLVELPVLGETGKKKWVMIVGRGPNKVQYFTGEFDGEKFHPDHDVQALLNEGKGLAGELFDDFEKNHNNWFMDGNLFADAAAGNRISDFMGIGYGGSLRLDANTGHAHSKPFVINTNAINFLLAGGKNMDSLSFSLVVGGKTVCRSTGDNNRVFRWYSWDVRELKGKTAQLELTDKKIDGGIAVDHIILSDAARNWQNEQALWLDFGEDFYATKTWRNYDREKNRDDTVLLISWMGNWRYARIGPTTWGSGFQTVPRIVALKRFPEGLRVVQQPIPALQSLRREKVSLKRQPLRGTMHIPGFTPAQNTYELDVNFDATGRAPFGLNLLVGEGRKLVLKYDPVLEQLSLDRTRCTDYTANADFHNRFATVMYANAEPVKGKLRLHIFVDQSSIEVFTNEGKVVLSAVTYPSPGQTGVELFSENNSKVQVSLQAWMLGQIW